MSHTELHIGKLRPVEVENIEEFSRLELEKNGVTEMKSYYDSWVEALADYGYEKYMLVNNVLYEIFDHKEYESDDEINELIKNEDGSYSFISQFYNGSTALPEMIEVAFLKAK